MPKNDVNSWDLNADANTDVGGNDIGENCPPSSINNAIRTVMAQIRVWYATVPRLGVVNTFANSIGVGGAVPGADFNNGKALAIGDSDTGIRQSADGVFEIWSNNTLRASISPTAVSFTTESFKVNTLDLVYNNAGTYNINVTGNAGTAATATNSNQLGGFLANLYLRKSELRSEFSGIGTNEIGSIAILSRTVSAAVNPGETSQGSNLKYSNFDGSNLSGLSPDGVWMALSRVSGSSGINSVGLWKRVS